MIPTFRGGFSHHVPLHTLGFNTEVKYLSSQRNSLDSLSCLVVTIKLTLTPTFLAI